MSQNGKVIKEKYQKRKVSMLFKNNYFRVGGKWLAFERKKVNSQFLFYHIAGTPLIFHISNLMINEVKTFQLYNLYSHSLDIEQHEGFIYLCGGDYSNQGLNDCMVLSISNFKIAHPVKISNMIDKRGYTCTISTPHGLFVLGGYTPYVVKLCEKYTPSNGWKKVGDLQVASYAITASYIYPNYIYTFGGAPQIYEKLKIKSEVNSQWEIINIPNNLAGRCYGCTLHMKKKKVLVFGGTEGTCSFSIFHLFKDTVKMTGISFNKYLYHGSRPRLIGEALHVISSPNYPQGKRIIITSIKQKKIFRTRN